MGFFEGGQKKKAWGLWTAPETKPGCFSRARAVRGAGSAPPHPTGLQSSSSPDYKFPNSRDLASPAVIEMQGAGEKVTTDSINIIGGDGAAWGQRAQTKRPLSCRWRRDGPAAAGSRDGGQGQRWSLPILFPPLQAPFLMPIKLIKLTGYRRLSVPTEGAGRSSSHLGHAGGETEAPCKGLASHPLQEGSTGVFIPWGPSCESV